MIFIALDVSRLERSAAYYRDTFGIELHWDSNDPVSGPWIGGPHSA
jgi:catechol 2,3-dioxygenase-like lactoylglutathione lyase family enzyme